MHGSLGSGALGALGDYFKDRDWRGLRHHLERLGYKCLIPSTDKPGIMMPGPENIGIWMSVAFDLVPPVARELPPWKKSPDPYKEWIWAQRVKNPNWKPYQSGQPSQPYYIPGPPRPPPVFGSKKRLEMVQWRPNIAPRTIESFVAFMKDGTIGRYWQRYRPPGRITPGQRNSDDDKGLGARANWLFSNQPIRIEMSERAPREKLGARTRVEIVFRLGVTPVGWTSTPDVDVVVVAEAAGTALPLALHGRQSEIQPAWTIPTSLIPGERYIDAGGGRRVQVGVPAPDWAAAVIDILITLLEAAFDHHREVVGAVMERVEKKEMRLDPRGRGELKDLVYALVRDHGLDEDGVVDYVLHDVGWIVDEDVVRRMARGVIRSQG